MNTQFEARTSIIIFNLLLSNKFEGKFLLPANVCPIVPATFLKAGVTFEFIDISSETMSMDLVLAIDKLNTNPSEFSGIFYVRQFGYLSDTSKFFNEIKTISEDFIIFDDKCLCAPQFFPKYCGADVELYSTGYSKFIDLGWGGYAFVCDKLKYRPSCLEYSSADHEALIDSFKEIQNTSRRYVLPRSNWLGGDKQTETFEEYSNNIQSKLQETSARKEQINTIYAESLPQEIQLPEGFHCWRFNILVDSKNLVLEKIFEENLFASSHYCSISHNFGNARSPVAEEIYLKQVNLFNDFRFTPDMAIKVCEIIEQSL